MPDAKIQNGRIVIDNRPVQIISGAIHYFRVHPGLWEDRLDKAAACGLNTVETYFCWNLHEPAPGQFDFSGILDFERFLNLAAERGLYVIARPGPYICAEWENGGFPGWLAAVPGIRLRCKNKPYLDAVERYFNQLLPRLRRHLLCNGGNIIAVQVENEYGSYGCDTAYLEHLRGLMIREGFDRTILFTSDGADNYYLNGGRCPGCLTTANFGSGSEKNFRMVRTYQPEGPDFCMEWWLGWFDHWGAPHHERNADDAVPELEAILKAGANINMYMFHGGTNFGFTAGANGNCFTDYAPTITSYDYDAPLTEAGDPGPKFAPFQEMIARYTDNPRIRPVAPSKKCVPSTVQLTETLPLFQALDSLTSQSGFAEVPPTMEELAPDTTGFIYYRKLLKGPLTNPVPLRFNQVNDYVQVYFNGKYQGSCWRPEMTTPFASVTCGAEGLVLELLVENCGRINYGPFIGRDRKGIAGFVALDLQMQTGWEYRTLPLNRLPSSGYGTFTANPGGCAFHRGSFEVSDIGETFIDTPGEKGLIWINGFNLGRYWKRGPQKRLYVPSPVLKKGRNEVVVLELEKLDSDRIAFAAESGLK